MIVLLICRGVQNFEPLCWVVGD